MVSKVRTHSRFSFKVRMKRRIKNFINDTSFFEWDKATHNSCFKKFKDAVSSVRWL